MSARATAAASNPAAAATAVSTRRTALSPAGGGAFACEACRLTGDGTALADPGGERFHRGRFDTGGVGAMVADPGLHGREQLRRELAIAAEQREIRVLGLVQPVKSEVGMPAVFD